MLLLPITLPYQWQKTDANQSKDLLFLAAFRHKECCGVLHEKIEAWILEQAGVTFDTSAAPGALRVAA